MPFWREPPGRLGAPAARARGARAAAWRARSRLGMSCDRSDEGASLAEAQEDTPPSPASLEDDETPPPPISPETALNWLDEGKTLKKPTAKKMPVAKPPAEPVAEYKPRAEPGRPACPPKYHLVRERRAMQEWIRDNRGELRIEPSDVANFALEQSIGAEAAKECLLGEVTDTLLAQWRFEQKETCQIPTSGAAMKKRSEYDMAAAEGDPRGKQYAKEYGHAKRRLAEARKEWIRANGWRVAVPTAIWPRDPQKKERPWYPPLKLLSERQLLEVPDAKYWPHLEKDGVPFDKSKGGHDDSAQGGDNKGGHDDSTQGSSYSKGGHDGNKGGHDYSSKGGHDYSKGGHDGNKGGYHAGGYHGSKDGYDGTQV